MNITNRDVLGEHPLGRLQSLAYPNSMIPIALLSACVFVLIFSCCSIKPSEICDGYTGICAEIRSCPGGAAAQAAAWCGWGEKVPTDTLLHRGWQREDRMKSSPGHKANCVFWYTTNRNYLGLGVGHSWWQSRGAQKHNICVYILNVCIFFYMFVCARAVFSSRMDFTMFAKEWIPFLWRLIVSLFLGWVCP